MSPGAAPLFGRVRPGFIAALLLAWFWGQAVSVSAGLGITNDEPGHLTAGFSYGARGDFRLQPENGWLPQRLAALPLSRLHLDFPSTDRRDWQHADTRSVAQAFLFESGNPTGRMVLAGRMMIATLAVGLGVILYFWAQSLFGSAGGLVTLALFAGSPNLLAHASLATSDMAAAAGFVMATLAAWRLLHRVTAGRIVLAAVAFAFLALAKHSAALFGAVLPLLWLAVVGLGRPLPLHFFSARRRFRGWAKTVILTGAVGLALAGSYALIWAAYGFRYSAAADGRDVAFPVPWETLLAREPFRMGPPVLAGLPRETVLVEDNPVRSFTGWARDHRILPEAYLYGFLHTYTYSRWRQAFFLGEYGITGWPAYFPAIYLLKTPLAVLALLGLAAFRLARIPRKNRPGRQWYRLLPVFIFIVVYGLFTLTSRLNIGYRHLLPLEVMLCILAGAVAFDWSARNRLWKSATLVLLLAVNLASWTARPDYLTYFNPLAGEPANAYRLFADSALDWGQGLPALSRWLRETRPTEPVYLTYFGADSPAYHGLHVTRIGDGYFRDAALPAAPPISPGWFVVSSTLLDGDYTAAPGPWTRDHETLYRQLRAVLVSAGSFTSDQARAWDQIRFARLRHYLLAQKPVAQPDLSLLVYRLSSAQLDEALP